MFHFLSHLHARLPLIRVRRRSRARVAHVPLHHIFHHKTLLQNSAVQHLFLHRQLCLQPFRVRLGPYEPGVHQLHFIQSLHPFDAKRQQFFALQIRANPVFRRLQIPPALVAMNHRTLLLYSLGDIDSRFDALDAHAGRVRGDGRRAHAAQNVPRLRTKRAAARAVVASSKHRPCYSVLSLFLSLSLSVSLFFTRRRRRRASKMCCCS